MIKFSIRTDLYCLDHFYNFYNRNDTMRAVRVKQNSKARQLNNELKLIIKLHKVERGCRYCSFVVGGVKFISYCFESYDCQG